MARYKGQITPKMNERDYPHFVDIGIPEGVLGSCLNAMYDWHRQRGLQTRRGRGGLKVARFCFADPAVADAFAEAFSGMRREP